jgi:transcriptional regulator of nitric oxide reductase
MTAQQWAVFVPVAVAVVGGMFGLLTMRASKERAKQATPIDEMQKVVDAAHGLMTEMRTELSASRDDRVKLEGEVRRLRRRVGALEDAYRRLGGDPAMINGD